MVATVVILSLALIAVFFVALRYGWNRFHLSFHQEAKLEEMKAKTTVMALREQVMREFLSEIKLSYVAQGQAEGYKEIARTMPAIYGKHIDAMIVQMEANTDRIVQGELAKHRLLLGNVDIDTLKEEVKKAALNNRVLLENQEELMKQRDNWKQRYEQTKDDQNLVKNPVQTPSEGDEKQEESRNQLVRETVKTEFELGSDGVSGMPIQGKVMNFTPEYHYDDTHKSYYFDFEETGEGLAVILKRQVDDKQLGRFMQSQLKRGEILVVGRKNIILCGLPSCNVVKVTQQSNTRCCSRPHTTSLRLLDEENERIGSQ